MLEERTLWLVVNATSGGNSEDTLATVIGAFDRASCRLARTVGFPEDDPPSPARLDAAGVDLLAVFTGDGSVNRIVTGLYGWGGAVLVLPGGTMNLLSKRIHGDAGPEEILRRVAAGQARLVRPTLVRSRFGDALTEIMAGPGTAWSNVREALRDVDVAGVIGHATGAIGETAGGPKVACRQPACGREEGYSLITLTAADDAIAGDGYYAETIADYARQGIALLRRNFRDGPHEALGLHRAVELACLEGEPMGLLIDGEPAEGEAVERFSLARCGVDLLATADVG